MTGGSIVDIGDMNAPENDLTPPPPDPTLDTDSDGLTDAQEAELNTDPNNPDSDGDQHSDLEEVNANSDPLDSARFPYQGGWPIGACRDFVPGMGTAQIGDTLPTLILPDQFGDDVHISDFCDRNILFVFQAGWCGICNEGRGELLANHERLRAANIMIIEVLGENARSGPPETEDALRWSQDAPWPVLIDSSFEATLAAGLLTLNADSSISLSYFSLVAPGLILEELKIADLSNIGDVLAELVQRESP